MKRILAVLTMLLLSGSAWASCGSNPLAHEEAFRLSAVPLSDHAVEVRIEIEPCYYLYQDKLKFSLTPAEIGKVAMPVGTLKQDSFFGQTSVYYGKVTVTLPFAPLPKGASVTLKAEYQGCAEAIGLCYPLSAQMLTFMIPKSAGPGEEVFAREPKKRWF
jgi:Thiol:disulfide interchange protein